ncbi:S1C family serine protease [Paenibacillus sp. IHBB 10380]|uniref:S1C family serine protease n=1 Tax=Paenibacillus sp. IHBB 10380 TaxID=1566358 RepID=UPI0005CFE0B5|nr:trypsin-like peptidase domain-containing protein [Paenibacillus sp. IHBB 10380]AJS59475.1 peptidase S1 [Paenibacillus sp. IHBB 10380]
MSRGVLASVIICTIILGGGTGGAVWIHKSAEQQLNNGPLLAVAPVETVAAQSATAMKEPKTRKEIIEASQKRVVTIESSDGIGSGFLYNNQGDLLTNAHVVEGSQEVIVRTLNHEEYKGIVIGVGVDTDVAVVRVQKMKNMSPLPIARKFKAEIGDEILALGSPLGLENTVTTGIISGVNRSFEIDPYIYSNLYQISAPITKGNSGGPLVNAVTGEVLGINSAGVTQEAGIGFSIPIKSVLKQVEEWSNHPMTELPRSSNSSENDTGYDDSFSSSEDLVAYFYQSLNTGDYVTAYSLIGSDWQSSTSYENFRKGYLKTTHVTIEEVIATDEDDNGAQVSALITAEERRSGGTVYQLYRLSYTLGYENGQLKILHGKGKKK